MIRFHLINTIGLLALSIQRSLIRTTRLRFDSSRPHSAGFSLGIIDQRQRPGASRFPPPLLCSFSLSSLPFPSHLFFLAYIPRLFRSIACIHCTQCHETNKEIQLLCRRDTHGMLRLPGSAILRKHGPLTSMLTCVGSCDRAIGSLRQPQHQGSSKNMQHRPGNLTPPPPSHS
jgi:hypothetical protein